MDELMEQLDKNGVKGREEQWEYDIIRLKSDWDKKVDESNIKGLQVWELFIVITKIPIIKTRDILVFLGVLILTDIHS